VSVAETIRSIYTGEVGKVDRRVNGESCAGRRNRPPQRSPLIMSAWRLRWEARIQDLYVEPAPEGFDLRSGER
jgi:hypothetical protein